MNKGSYFKLIQRRTSMRSYDGRPLTAEDKQEMERRLAGSLTNPFGASVRLPLIEGSKLAGQKLGTYGVIRGTNTFIAGVAKPGGMDAEGLGYVMERVVLEATAIGLGTCWLAGTFDHSAFRQAAGLAADERVIAVSPVGYPAGKRTLVDTVMRGVAGSARRKGWGELFFDGTPGAALSEQAAGEYRDALEAVRLAPSGSNRQPWRIIRRGDKFHFYRSAKPGSGMGRVDMGIAACHFELVAREAGLSGRWNYYDSGDTAGGELIYFASWNASD